MKNILERIEFTVVFFTLVTIGVIILSFLLKLLENIIGKIGVLIILLVTAIILIQIIYYHWYKHSE